MEIKKNQQLTTPAQSNIKEEPTRHVQWGNFFGEIKSEFKKISWTNPEELISYTKIVVAATFLFGMGLYVMDLMIQICLNSLGFVLRLIAG